MNRTRPRGTRRQLQIPVGSKNVYADLNVRDSGIMLAKAKLVAKIAVLLQRRRVTQQQSANFLRMSPSKVSGVLRGNFRGISIGQLERCLARLEKRQRNAH